jgi:predicted acylesterase/phospholipase RssA
VVDGQALVLGGGGVAGIAWMTGVLAGAAVAAQVGSGLSLDALFARQVEPALQAREISDELDMEKFAAEFGALLTRMTSAESAQEAQRRATVGSRLPSPDWPSRRMLLVAADAETGQTRVFDRQSGVDLIDAVAASCAVPGVWPPGASAAACTSTAASGPATTPTSRRVPHGSWCCHRWATARRSRRRCRCGTWSAGSARRAPRSP